MTDSNTIPLDPNAPDDPGDSNISVAEYRRKARESKLELAFEGQLRQLFMAHGWDRVGILREFAFDMWHGRAWRADFAIDVPVATGKDAPEYCFTDAGDILLVEIEGGTRQYGRHNRHDGFTNDAYKYSAASALGYTILRGTSTMVNDGMLLRMVEDVLTGDLHIENWKAT